MPPLAPPHWRSLEDAQRPTDARDAPTPEFPQGADLPPEGEARRDFLKLLGTWASVAGLASCTRAPREPRVPYVRQPPEVKPGIPLHFATALPLGGLAVGVVVRSDEGRPTKVEGNPEHPASLGAAGVFEQAALVSLYDTQRARVPTARGAPTSLAAVFERLSALSRRTDQGRGLAFLLEPTSSPLLQWARSRIREQHPEARLVPWAPVSESEVEAGARLAYGRPLRPQPEYGEADVVLALDDDFLATLPGNLPIARAFTAARMPDARFTRLYAVECHLTLVGAFADHRLRLRNRQLSTFALALVGEVGARTGRQALQSLRELAGRLPERARHFLSAATEDLLAHRGKALLVAGPRQPPEVHAAVHLVNHLLGAPVTLREPVGDIDTGPSALEELVRGMEGGDVDTLVVTAFNPVYSAPADVPFRRALARVSTSVYWGLHGDATAQACTLFVPAAHPLESWGDGRAQDGSVALMQPLIAPLFDGLQEADVLAPFLGAGNKRPRELLAAFWREKAGEGGGDVESRWKEWLARGVVPGTQVPSVQAPFLEEAVVQRLLAFASEQPPETPDTLEVAWVPSLTLYDGRFASNAWLQELPEPVTKQTWGNAALLSPATAQRLGVAQGQVLRLTYQGRTLEAPALPAPGHADDSITLPLGFGREDLEGTGAGVGVDAYRLRTSYAPWFDGGLQVEVTPRREELALTQEHWSMEGRHLAVELTREELRRKPDPVLEQLRGPVERLYDPAHPEPEYAWAMSVDLHRCTGCSACVVACQAENNVPVVGRAGVLRSREMHWLRIDRYFTGDVDEPGAITQPVLCVHCETAPCEYVCPVNATVHHSEGFNQMVYNRCVGTRYCSNNCPYKVRRFNYLDYHATDGPLERLKMNPEVTVRERGVMEKCTWCIQRVQAARIQARLERRSIRDGEVRTACQQACPTEAIVFGSLTQPAAKVTALFESERRYDLLHELGTRPRTVYQVRLKNPNEELA